MMESEIILDNMLKEVTHVEDVSKSLTHALRKNEWHDNVFDDAFSSHETLMKGINQRVTDLSIKDYVFNGKQLFSFNKSEFTEMVLATLIDADTALKS